MPINIEIRTTEERETAGRLIERLMGAIEDSPEESKLKMLLAACEAWDAKCKRALLCQPNPFCALEESQAITAGAAVPVATLAEPIDLSRVVPAGGTPMAFTIRSQDDYETAIARVQELRNRSPATVAEESELRHLLGAADDWDRTMGSEAAGERSTADTLALETGAGFALLMARLFPERDWVAELANSLGQKRSYVERHLQHDVMPPPDLVDAAQRLVNARRNQPG